LKQNLLKSYIHLHILVFIFGFTGILGKLISLSAESLVFYRLALTVPALWVVMKVMKVSFVATKQQLRQYAVVGSILGLHWICFFGAIKFSNVSVALSCLATASIFASLLEPLHQRRKIEWLDVVISAVVFLVLAYILGLEMSYWLGAALGIAAALFGAWVNVLNKKLVNTSHPINISFYELFGAMIPVLIFLSFTTVGFSEFPTPRIFGESNNFWTNLGQSDWLWLLILALVCTAYPFAANVHLMKKLSAFSVTFAINFEPIYSIVLAYLIFGESERMKPEFYIGVALILVLILFYPILKSKVRKPPC
jgi:drug/metabolite transporter (DMT)-like permease